MASRSPGGQGPIPWRPLLATLAALVWTPALGLGASTERVSVSTAGEQGNGDSPGWAGLSADGRYVAFSSLASNLVPGDTNAVCDAFVHDRWTGTTERVSVSSGGQEANGDAGTSSISADGRYVVVESVASNLVPGDANDTWDVFVYDRDTGSMDCVSVSSAGEAANADCGAPSISADGRHVVFLSAASNLVADDTNEVGDVFVHDRLTRVTNRVSVSSSGAEGNGWYGLGFAYLSADGRYVAFVSAASNLVPGDTNGVDDAFVHDRQTGATERVSMSSTGAQADSDSYWSGISADGRYVVFTSAASAVVPGDTNGQYDVFVHDRLTGATERVSVTSSGEETSNRGWWSCISGDGRYVVFSWTPWDSQTFCGDIFRRDRLAGVTERVDLSATGQPANGACEFPSISADGAHVAFGADADNLVADDTNQCWDVFARHLDGSFPDVPSDHWAFPEIMACYASDIVSGYWDGTYRPNQAVTRDQMAVYVSRALAGGDEQVPSGPATPTFPDVPTDHWAYRYVEYCYDQAVLEGYWDGYHPDEVVNRAQMAVFIARSMVAPSGDAAIPHPEPPATFPDVPTTYWAWKWVEYCYDQGVVQGYWDGYHPDETVNRAQIAVYVQRAFNLPP